MSAQCFVNPRLVTRRAARLPPGHLQCGRRRAQRTRADSQRRRAGAWCSGEGRPQRWPAHRLHNPTALSQETGDSHTGDSHAGASVQRGAGQSLQCARPVLHPRQVSLTLYRVWEAAQGTRLPGHLSWLQTGTPKLSVTLTPGRDRSRRRQGARQAPAAGDPPCGSVVSSGRKCVSIRVMRTLGAVRKDELCHVLSWGSMTRVAGLSSTCAGDVWCVWAPCAQTRGPVASCPRGSLYASTRCPRAHVGTLHAPSEGKGPGVSQACSVDSEDSKTPSGNVPLLSRGKRVPLSVRGLSMPYSCPHPTLSPPSGCPQPVPCSPQEA